MNKKLITNLPYISVPFLSICIGILLSVVTAHADTTNLSTGCIHNSGANKGMVNKFQIGTSPTSPCSGTESQVSFDYGDITSVIAGTGLAGGATQGAATVSIANGGVGTTQLANDSVTAAKISSETATNGKVLTADGSGGASWQTSSGGNAAPLICPGCYITGALADHIRGKDLTDSFFGENPNSGGQEYTSLVDSDSAIDLSNTNFIDTDWDQLHGHSTTAPFNFNSDNFTGAVLTNMCITEEIDPTTPNTWHNVNFTNANLTNSFEVATTTGCSNDNNDFTGAIYSNTTCPDGTNSNSDGGTCTSNGM